MKRWRAFLRWLRALLVGVPRADHIGIAAEFDDPDALLDAIHRLRERKLTLMDAYVPYQVEGLEEALGLERARIPWLIGICGFTGAALAYLLMWWINVVDFPRNVGARPLHSAPSFIPITFETGILFGGTTAFVALFLSGGMPRLWDPLFEVPGFESASVDGYWLGVDRRDPEYDEEPLRDTLREMGAKRVELVEEAS
jgi:Alternative complex III, ActD subunit